MSRRWYIVLAWIATYGVALATPIGAAEQRPLPELRLSTETPIVLPGLQYELLRDTSARLTFEDVRSSANWSRGIEANPNFGYTGDAVWFRYRLAADTSLRGRPWLMVVSYPYLQWIDAWFVMADGSVVHDQSGTHAPKYTTGAVDRPRAQHEIALPTPISDIQEVVVRVETRLVMSVQLSFQDRNVALARSDRSPVILWLFMGLAGGLFAYNLFLYFFLRDRAYLLYLAYLGLFALFVPIAVDGYGTVLFPTYPWVTDHFLITLSAVANMSALAFTVEFLQFKIHLPRVYRWIWVLHGLWVVLGVAAIWIDPQISHQASNHVATVNIVVIGTGLVVAIRKRYRPAIFFAIGWSILLVLATIFIAQNLGQLPANYFTVHSLQFGVAAEMVMLSIALAARISEIRRRQQEDAKKALEGEIYRLRTIELQRERDNADRLLLNILPPVIATRLKQEENPIVDRFQNVAILFADIVGFTTLAEQMSPGELVSLLDDVFSEIDAIVQKHGLEKIKTIGDCYMAVSGLPEPRAEYLTGMAEAALELRSALEDLSARNRVPISMRIGIHVGEVVAGVIGRTKFAYDLWGAAVNLASRMETHGESGKVHVSEPFAKALGEHYEFEDRGEISIKGMGSVRSYFLVSRKTKPIKVG